MESQWDEVQEASDEKKSEIKKVSYIHGFSSVYSLPLDVI
jgi:hypothetical protein